MRPRKHEARVVLARTRRGSARRCPCCEKVEVVFGNAMFNLTGGTLSALHQRLSTVPDPGAGPGATPRLLVRLPGFVLLLSPEEVGELSCLLDVARRCL